LSPESSTKRKRWASYCGGKRGFSSAKKGGEVIKKNGRNPTGFNRPSKYGGGEKREPGPSYRQSTSGILDEIKSSLGEVRACFHTPGKPPPRVLFLLLPEEGVKKSETVMVGGNWEDNGFDPPRKKVLDG